jgi:hypothetical protein
VCLYILPFALPPIGSGCFSLDSLGTTISDMVVPREALGLLVLFDQKDGGVVNEEFGHGASESEMEWNGVGLTIVEAQMVQLTCCSHAPARMTALGGMPVIASSNVSWM